MPRLTLSLILLGRVGEQHIGVQVPLGKAKLEAPAYVVTLV